MYGSQTPMYRTSVQGNQTPMYGTRTPMYGSQTPLHSVSTGSTGSRTPMYGSQTPQHEAGSRTPHYGTQTPSHENSDLGAWDPTVANTPAPSYSEGSESGYSGAYERGSEFSEIEEPTGTPSPSSYAGTSSPSAYAGTPYSSGYGYSPMTPGAPSTPGSVIDHSSVEWQTTDIKVTVRDTHEDDGLSGQTGIIQGISAGMCSVFLPKEDRVVNILGEHLEPVTPEPGDKVKVILGDERESCGKLLSIDHDGVVKIGNNLRLIQLSHLCKME